MAIWHSRVGHVIGKSTTGEGGNHAARNCPEHSYEFLTVQ